MAQWMYRVLPRGEQPTHPGVFFDGQRLCAFGPNLGQDKLEQFLADIGGTQDGE